MTQTSLQAAAFFHRARWIRWGPNLQVVLPSYPLFNLCMTPLEKVITFTKYLAMPPAHLERKQNFKCRSANIRIFPDYFRKFWWILFQLPYMETSELRQLRPCQRRKEILQYNHAISKCKIPIQKWETQTTKTLGTNPLKRGILKLRRYSMPCYSSIWMD